jgi:GTP-binding protein HflX
MSFLLSIIYAGSDRDSGVGFRGPGESKVETDKRVIKDKIVLMKKEIESLGVQREQHRESRCCPSLSLSPLSPLSPFPTISYSYYPYNMRYAICRKRLGLPVVALVGYTNAGKSTLLNRLSNAGAAVMSFSFTKLYAYL